jgi:hypothetical protein
MAKLQQRRCAVNVDGVQVDGLRVKFKVTKTLVKEPNTLELEVYNLSENSRNQIKRKGAKVVVSAGYPGTEAVIFSGDARTVDHAKIGPDGITKIQCGDGERAFQFARFSKSFRPGTSVADVITAAAKSLGLDASAAVKRIQQQDFKGGLLQFVNGYAAHGKASSELDKLLKSVGLTWSIQDGAIQVLAPAETKGTAVLLSPDTGLVGSPEHGTPTTKGQPPVLKFRALLQPQIRVGGIVEIRSAGISGQFRVQKLEHLGDTAGSDWYTSGEATPR